MTRRPAGHWVVMGLFAAVGINAMVEVPDGLGDQSSSGMLIVAALQTVTAVLAFLTVRAVWIRAAWSTLVITLWGAVSAVMIVLLEPLLELGRDARGGLITGALVILAVAACSAWYVRRSPGASR